ncbi:hypothetical protein BZL29_2984 [Mycobacterium kansasii]|uniref:Uncharacterized protein n=1 Tax=Mycobacterium kansasii TaxID=1768 RepID=A0A1V3XC68_MYCKA|nr:hypothetical protein BZL29_2984 [Mycobacterium kansasii]
MCLGFDAVPVVALVVVGVGRVGTTNSGRVRRWVLGRARRRVGLGGWARQRSWAQ